MPTCRSKEIYPVRPKSLKAELVEGGSASAQLPARVVSEVLGVYSLDVHVLHRPFEVEVAKLVRQICIGIECAWVDGRADDQVIGPYIDASGGIALAASEK